MNDGQLHEYTSRHISTVLNFTQDIKAEETFDHAIGQGR